MKKVLPLLLYLLLMNTVLFFTFFLVNAAKGFPGESSRIMFFHVPLAWITSIAFFICFLASIGYLLKRKRHFDNIALANAEIGLLFCILTTLTGAIFSRAAWGQYWNWDPRQTSIVLLLMIYFSYFVLRGAVKEQRKKCTFASVYAIMAFCTVPFLIFIVPRITMSLHPEDTMNPRSSNIDAKTFYVFIGNLVSYSILFVWLMKFRLKCLKIESINE